MPPSVPQSPPATVSPTTSDLPNTSATNFGNGENPTTYPSTQADPANPYGENNANNQNTSAALISSPYGGGGYGAGGMYGGGMYGGGMYGGGMYGGGMNSMYGGYGGGMMSPYGMMSAGPLSGLNQLLFSVQSVIFSLSQAVNIIGMNTQGLRQLMESVAGMFDHAVETWQEMQSLEQMARQYETEEDRKRRARLRAMRMALVAGISYLGYRLVRRLLFPQQRYTYRPAIANQGYYNPGARPYGASSGYYP